MPHVGYSSAVTVCLCACSAERSFSGLKHIKTDLCSSMTNEHHNSLSLLRMHAIDIEKFIDEFSTSSKSNYSLNILTVYKLIIVFVFHNFNFIFYLSHTNH